MQVAVDEYFKMLNAYTPAFTSFEGGIYEMEITRAAIHTFANHCSKLKPVVSGQNNEALQRMLQFKPNPIMDTKKYLYRLATVLSVDNTAFIAPLENTRGEIVGFYPLLTSKCQIVTGNNGVKYLRYQFDSGKYGACELEKVGILNQYQYRDELFGESNRPLRPTLNLIEMQNQGIIEGIKNAASIRFMAKLGMSLKDEDIEKERKRFTAANLSSDNNGGVMMFDQKYAEVKQIDSKSYIVNPQQMAQIKENVFNYFGVSEDIIQNKFSSDTWNAYYEGKIEPFALEASLVHTGMVFSQREIAFKNEIMFTANRLQYLSNSEKLQTATSLFDRGVMSRNDVREIFNMPPVEDGDKLYIRKEYAEYNDVDSVESEEIDDADDE